jgi:serine/threonine protein kinase
MPLSVNGESSVDAGIMAAAPEKSDSEEKEEKELLESLKHATLGEYDIYALLGRGGMAAVFRAMELSLNRWVAIKVISPSALSSATVVDRFWLEARTAASLSHPNIIPIFAVRAVEGLHFFVMKHIEGGALDVVLKNEGPLSFPVVRTVLTQVSGALAYAHRRGVIHRDVKPANIMLDEEGYAIVMDFGIAKVRDVAALTASGAMVGTPYYMSPEQFNGQQVDGRSDQYSLGCVAFELLTGVRPFKGDSVSAVLRGHLLDKAPDVRSLRPDCPTSLATLVNRMLCKTPSDRFASMEVLYGQLEAMPRINADAMRDKITSLARTASLSHPQISEPQSPIPASRSSAEIATPPGQAQKPRGVSAPLTQFVRRRPWLSVGITAGVLSAVIALKTVSSAGHGAPTGNTTSRPPRVGLTQRSAERPAISDSPSVKSHVDETTSFPLSATSSPKKNNQPKATSSLAAKTPARTDQVTQEKSASQRELAQTAPITGGSSVATKPVLPNAIHTPSAGNGQPLLGMNFAPVQSEPPPLPAPVRTPPAFRIGTRIPAAFLYVDGRQVGLLRGLNTFTHAAGDVHLQIRADDCLTWDTVITVAEGDTAKIGYRNPACGR